MSASESSSIRGKPFAAVIAVVALLCPLGYSTAAALFGGAGDDDVELFLAAPLGAEKKCIRPIEYMRFRHMDLLTEMRDAGVRHGARREVTFTDCTECHSPRGEFCDRCHEAVNLLPDCFHCHYYP